MTEFETTFDGSMKSSKVLRKPLLALPVVDLLFQGLAILSLVLAFTVLVTLVGKVVWDGLPRLSWEFLTSFPSRMAERAGIFSALVGSIYMIILTVIFSTPLGVGAAVYLEEYAAKNRVTALIEICIANLAGVPSVIYGLLGLQIFARLFGFERSLISGALTMTLLILPIVIIASREAIRAVPKAYREGAIALGATKWQTIRTQVLPVAFPGVMTGCILAFSRALGETAPLVTLGALTYVAFLPDSLFAPFTVLPIQTFNWLSRPQEAFHANAAAAISVLLIIMLCLNLIAIFIRAKLQRRQR